MGVPGLVMETDAHCKGTAGVDPSIRDVLLTAPLDGLQAALGGSGRPRITARCDTPVVRAFAVLVSFWAAGTWGLWLVITRGLGPAAQFEGGWTAYTPLSEGDLVASTGAGMWDAGMWDLVTLWLAVMLTVTAIGAWSAAFVAHRNPGPPPPS